VRTDETFIDRFETECLSISHSRLTKDSGWQSPSAFVVVGLDDNGHPDEESFTVTAVETIRGA
jgi:hypothetical protein